MHRTWKPKITENTTHFNKFQHSVHYSGDDEKYSKDHSSDHSTSVPLKVSLEHQNQVIGSFSNQSIDFCLFLKYLPLIERSAC